MLSKKVIMVPVIALGLTTLSCTSDEEAKPKDPVSTTQEEPVPPPDDSARGFSPETVYFAFDDYTLNSEAQGKLSGMADFLKGNKKAVVNIEGHCDERGSIEYNLALGERRAQSVKNYLVRMGVDAARLPTVSYGEEKPAAEGHDESAWSRNRRAEFGMSNQ